VLVVDDSPTEARIISTLVKENGYDVVMAASGDEAINAAKSEKLSLILLDVVMPGKNGFQVCRMLKNDPFTKNTPIIMVTAKSLPPDKFWGMKQGADDYITKPFDSALLMAAVKKLI
jgi:twitching motility two-component system response regulator PilH